MEAREKKQLLLDSRYLRMTQIWAENSYCRRRQVGALLVKDKMIISDGYNGTPSGFENVHAATTAVTERRCMSPPHPAWSVANSSSRPASAASCSVSTIACTTAWICCAVPASRWSTCGNTEMIMNLLKSPISTARAIIRK